ncbi:hypothetical protein ACFLQU_03550 [Verrucomicrobiota bacterium]
MRLKSLVTIAIASLFCQVLICHGGADNTVTFDNQSGQPALVKLIGPTPREVDVPVGQRRTVTVAAGQYHIKTRYGTPGKYRYTKGDEFIIKSSAKSRSETSITLHKVAHGNYSSQTISAVDFDSAPVSKSTLQYDLATVAHRRDLWPKTVLLNESVTFPVMVEGRRAGGVQARRGQKLELLQVSERGVLVRFGKSRKLLNLSQTDLPERVEKIAAIKKAKAEQARNRPSPARTGMARVTVLNQGKMDLHITIEERKRTVKAGKSSVISVSKGTVGFVAGTFSNGKAIVGSTFGVRALDSDETWTFLQDSQSRQWKCNFAQARSTSKSSSKKRPFSLTFEPVSEGLKSPF